MPPSIIPIDTNIQITGNLGASLTGTPPGNWTITDSTGRLLFDGRSRLINETTRAKAIRKLRDQFAIYKIQSGPAIPSINRIYMNTWNVNLDRPESGMDRYWDRPYIDGIVIYRVYPSTLKITVRFPTPYLVEDRPLPPAPTGYNGYSSDPAHRAHRLAIRNRNKYYQRLINIIDSAADQAIEQLANQGIIRIIQFNALRPTV